MSEKDKKQKRPTWKRLKGTTNFYPTYVDGNSDVVTPTSATYRTEFQKIFPRYELSMTETRDKGTGPTFLETEYNPPNDKINKQITPKKHSLSDKLKSKSQHRKKKKIRTDFWE